MMNTLTLEDQVTNAGLSYGRRHDISYRVGLVVQVLGLALLAVLYPLDNPFYTVGIMVFEIGVVLSAIYLLVWMRSVKVIILASVFVGIALQIIGMFFAPEEHAPTVIIAGISIVCLGSGGMAGKEAFCFGYQEGWALMLAGFPLMALQNLFGKENVVFNSLGFSILFLLALSLTGKKLKQKVLTPSPANACGSPASKDL